MKTAKLFHNLQTYLMILSSLFDTPRNPSLNAHFKNVCVHVCVCVCLCTRTYIAGKLLKTIKL